MHLDVFRERDDCERSPDDWVQKAIRVIVEAARTGKIGDGLASAHDFPIPSEAGHSHFAQLSSYGVLSLHLLAQGTLRKPQPTSILSTCYSLKKSFRKSTRNCYN